MAARFSGPGQPYEGLAKIGVRTGWHPKWTGDVRLVPEHLADPLRWRRPRKVFVNSMSDLFHEKLTNEEIAAVFGVMAAAPRHTFQILTKRAKRMRDWFRWIERDGVSAREPLLSCELHAARHGVIFPTGTKPALCWPLPNVWLGVSVEDQRRADERIPLLLETPAAVRFVSAEPLLGPVNLERYLPCLPPCGPPIDHGPALSWVIVGAESGPGARPMQEDWARSIRDQCAAAGVAFHFKQTVDPVNGKKTHLPVLDGVRHNAFPGGAR